MKSIVVSSILLVAPAALAQSTVTLTASPQTATLPDGQQVPMWGYTCGDALVPPAPSVNATCTAADGLTQAGGAAWQPPIITVPAGDLTINLVNQLSFSTAVGGTNTVPTSLVVLGQVGGGLGGAPARMPSPTHAPQGTTWPGTLGGIDPATTAIAVTVGGAGYVSPPAVTVSGDGSGATAVAYVANGAVTRVAISNPGSGYSTASVQIAPPPCTINGSTCVRATASISVSTLGSTDGSATFVPPAQADRVRSFGTEAAAGAPPVALTWKGLRPGTYLLESGTEPSIQVPMGLYGVLVVTEADTAAGAHQAYGTTFDAAVPLLLSEIDPAQNGAVDTAVHTDQFSDLLAWDGDPGQCGDPTIHTCYPPAVNYSPRYFLLNGTSFSAAAPAASSVAVPAAGPQGRLLLRLVNAGLRMHVPAVVGAPLTLVAEDGNKLPGTPRVQNEVFLAAGKTYDVTIAPRQTTGGAYDPVTFAIFDRAGGTTTNNSLDGGMQGFLQVAGGALPAAATVSASDKIYYCAAGTPLAVSDPAKGLLAGASGANGVSVGTTTADISVGANGTLALSSDGTFVYTPSATATAANRCGGTFQFLVNGTLPKTATIAQCDINSSTAAGCSLPAAPTVGNIQFTSAIATRFAAPPPGVLAGVTSNPSGYALTAGPVAGNPSSVSLNLDGSFVVTSAGAGACPGNLVPAAPPGSTCVSFQFQARTPQGVTSPSATATVVFLQPSNLVVNVKDAPTGLPITDYRWIIEEDRTFWIDPKCQVNVSPRPLDSDGHPCPPLPVESLGYNFHSAGMPVVAQGCVGRVSCEVGQTQGGADVVCDVGNGACRFAGGGKVQVLPSAVHLDPNKRYYISVLPGDGINPTIGGAGGPDASGAPFTIASACGAYAGPTGAWEPGGTGALCGHAMGGAQIGKAAAGATARPAVNISLQQTPLPTAKIAVFVFQDDNPLNGENDAGGGVDVLAPNEPGLGGFEIKLFDQAGGLGDATGQITYDMFNQPVSNALAGHVDPITGLDACPITARTDGLVGMIPTCPHFEADGVTPSPLEGQAVIANLYPGLYEIQAYPAADRIARGEEWLQTNTLDGGKPHEAFIKPNEPGYFQEFGPGGFHVSIGFANPAIINARKRAYCQSALNAGHTCNATLTVNVTNTHMSRTPDQRTYSSETYDHYAFTNCYVSIGPADAEDFALAKCSPDGTATFTGMPNGVFKISVFDQWNDIMLDGLTGTVTINGNTTLQFPATQWRANLYTRTFIDGGDGTSPIDGVSQPSEPGLALVNTNIHYRDGSIGFFNNTDLNGFAAFNEVFPFMNWLVVETSSTRYKPTGVHTVYDAGGPVDCSVQATALGLPCKPGGIADHLASTAVRVPLPAELRLPGARYCDTADCDTTSSGASTGTVFPPMPWGTQQAWQGLLGQNSFMEFGYKPFAAGENGGIQGMVIYASTRPFDDPTLSLQLQWEPGVANVKVNLYRKDVDAGGNEKLTLVDTTTTTSWDDWSQGFRRDGGGNLMRAADGGFIPNMNCPGQDATSPFFATLKGSKQWLDPDKKPLPYGSQFKCYDGWSQLNQIQPAPYDGLYKFPSVTSVGPDGKPAGTNCTGCVTNTNAAPTDWDFGKPMLPAGKYVVEVLLPPGYELVKEEDKNILLGDVYVAPVTQQFAGFGNIFIMPDQAAVNAAYNPRSPGGLNKTTDLGATPRHEGDTGSVETFWPCVGAERIVPDLNSLFPGAGQAAPFAGAKRRLCDRKEVTLQDQNTALAKFFIFSSTHVAGHFTGSITNDFASEFDPFSPQFGEKFGPPNLPVAMRDFNGNEVGRVYSDQWGFYNGLYFSTYGVNPPNPTGYVPQMAIACMNDPGPIPGSSGALVTDPAYNPAYSNFCYETPFMPGFTAYMDTPVIPTQSFADGYNLPDSEYPDATPAVSTVVSSAAPGPWVHTTVRAAAASATITFTGVGNGDRVTSVVAGAQTLTGGAITCNAASGCTGNGNARNARMATLVAGSIFARRAVTGVTASASGNTVTLTATATGPALNGTAVVVNATGITVGGTLVFAGGADASGASLALSITALGPKVVQNPNFSGPNATVAPFNQKTIVRTYDFGTTPGTVELVGADGSRHPLTGVTWGSRTITASVNANDLPPPCTLQQRGQPQARCGELVITRGDNGKRTIDAVTVTINGSAPWIVAPSGVTPPTGSTKTVKDYGQAFGRMGPSPIQVAIDSADPGDLVLVQPGTYRENLIMWKPVRLQGVGAAAVTINADAHPAGKMDQWRRQVNCAFGLTLDGVPNPNDAGFQGTDPTNAAYACPDAMHQRVDRIPFEAIIGWDASGNGNLAQVLQEPTLMGAYEGAGITVLGRGVRIPANSTDFWGQFATGGAGAFTDGSVYLSGGNADCASNPRETDGRDYGTSNYFCNPSGIDGVSILNSSQGGGGVFIHGWAHHLEVANTRISGNHGTLAGAINLGNGETPDAFVNDGVECGVVPPVMPCPPTDWTGPRSAYRPATNAAIAFQFNTFVRIHHNMLYNNASIGDALFSGTPAGAGAVTVSSGADGYQIDHNWIAGNLSTGDGGGIQHLGLSFQGKINNNYVLFNQSTNPTLPTSGGGVIVEGANLDRQLNGQECGSTSDQDCPPGLGNGTGFDLQIDANLILGNSAESGTGGGLRIQQVNGSELVAFQTAPAEWYDVTVTNNVIANNVAGWDGGGVSLQDALRVTLVNNTVVSNDTTASAGSLFKTLGAINANTPPPGCTPTTDPTLPQDPSCTGADAPHAPQPAGLVVQAHTPNLVSSIGPLLRCPTTAASGGAYGYSGAVNGDCRQVSKPALTNDLFFQNRAFSVQVVDANGNPATGNAGNPTGTGLQSQQNLIALVPLLNQTATGMCPAGASYWDVGVRTDDIAARAIPAGTRLTITNSILTSDPQGVVVPSGTNIVGGPSPVIDRFCNGARMPPEICSLSGINQNSPACKGYNAPPGASETTGVGTVFVLNGIKPTATVDEGHNWLNLSYGPLTLNRSAVQSGSPNRPELMIASAGTGTPGGAYSILGTSPAVNRGTNASVNGVAPAVDFFGNPRPRANGNPVDIGAVEYPVVPGTLVVANPAPLAFTDVVQGSGPVTRDLVLSNNGTTSFAVPTPTFTLAGFSRVGTGAFNGPPNCGANLAAGASCTIRVQWATPASVTSVAGTVTIGGVANSPIAIAANTVAPTFLATVAPSPVAFGNWATGTTSVPVFVTVTNTGNSTLTNLAFGGIAGAFSRVTPAAFPAGTPNCGNSLLAGSACAIAIQFAPTLAQAYAVNLTVTATGATVTPSPVPVRGTGVGQRATVSITPNPTVIALTSPTTSPGDPNNDTANAIVTLTNTCTAATCSSVAVTGVSVVTTRGPGTFSTGALAGPDTCTGAALAPGASCGVGVRYTVTPFSPRGRTATGTIRFTDTAQGSPQSGTLDGSAPP
jgi:hypothetical protein